MHHSRTSKEAVHARLVETGSDFVKAPPSGCGQIERCDDLKTSSGRWPVAGSDLAVQFHQFAPEPSCPGTLSRVARAALGSTMLDSGTHGLRYGPKSSTLRNRSNNAPSSRDHASGSGRDLLRSAARVARVAGLASVDACAARGEVGPNGEIAT